MKVEIAGRSAPGLPRQGRLASHPTDAERVELQLTIIGLSERLVWIIL